MAHLLAHLCNMFEASSHSEVAPLVLLELDTLEERLEVARPEPLVVVPLDYLDEHRRPVLQRLREDLEPQRSKGVSILYMQSSVFVDSI